MLENFLRAAKHFGTTSSVNDLMIKEVIQVAKLLIYYGILEKAGKKFASFLHVVALLISHRFVYGKFPVMFFCHQKYKSGIEYRCAKRFDHINQWHANTFYHMGCLRTCAVFCFTVYR